MTVFSLDVTIILFNQIFGHFCSMLGSYNRFSSREVFIINVDLIHFSIYYLLLFSAHKDKETEDSDSF